MHRAAGSATMPAGLSGRLLRPVWKAVIEFDMLAPGDRILAGFSGGKDSAFLLWALCHVQRGARFDFELAALTVELGFPGETDEGRLRDWCDRLGLELHLEKTEIGKHIFTGSQNPCARCAFLRRGAINDFALRHGFNKVALAHHLDDAVETFLMSQLYSGQVKTFLPRIYMDRSGITTIRPLVYLREEQIRRAVRRAGYEPIVPSCPVSGKTTRQAVGNMIRRLERENRFVFTNLVAAMRSAEVELWPPPLTPEEEQKKVREFWFGPRSST